MRTYSEERLVDRLIISFTHTTSIDWMLPGIALTGKYVEVVFVVEYPFNEAARAEPESGVRG